MVVVTSLECLWEPLSVARGCIDLSSNISGGIGDTSSCGIKDQLRLGPEGSTSTMREGSQIARRNGGEDVIIVGSLHSTVEGQHRCHV